MPKNLFQDMVKVRNSKREPPREIPSGSSRKIPKEIRRLDRRELPPREIPRYAPPRDFGMPHLDGDRKSHSGLWFIAAICIVFFIFALSFLFAKAEVTVNPKIKDFTLNENLSAIKDSNSDDLSFDLVIISGEEVKKVPATEEKDLSLNSEGTIFIYNTFSSDPQKLSINTRLEGSNGKIYKTAVATVIPGINVDGTPGRVQASILGEAAGQEYDSPPLDFKILGFKGTSKYDKFYGRSVGEITGGFKGKSGVVSDAEKESVFAELRISLQAKLLQKATDQIPSGFILFKDAAFLHVDSEILEWGGEAGVVPLKTKGTLYGFLFSEKELTAKIAKNAIPAYNDEPVYIPNIRDLMFYLADKDISFNDVQNINFNLSGSVKVVWKFDDTEFAGALLGKSKKDFNQILSQYPNVDSAELSLSPLWVRTMPSKLKDIKVIVDYPK